LFFWVFGFFIRTIFAEELRLWPRRVEQLMSLVMETTTSAPGSFNPPILPTLKSISLD
jgi:hypothetical protein